MRFFKRTTKQPEKTGIVFIVEDNKTYAETLRSFIQVNLPDVKEVNIFPVGETCLAELDKNPDVIIIDYFLDSKFPDAKNGLEIIKQIREQKPVVTIIVLSSQEEFIVIVEAVRQYNCSYVEKNQEAFEKVAKIMEEKK